MKTNIKDLIEYFDLKGSVDYGDTTVTRSLAGGEIGVMHFHLY